MSTYEFWHGDIRLLQAYEKAYLRYVSLRAWYQGKYDYVAYGITMHNAFLKKGQKAEDFPDYVDPIERYEKPKIKKENVEKEYIQQRYNQQAWFFGK